MDDFENAKEGYLVDGNQFPRPTKQFIEDAANYIKDNFPELVARLEKNNRNEGLDDWAAMDLMREISSRYKGLHIGTAMRLTNQVREFLHPCGLDWSKLDFNKRKLKQ